MTGRLIVFAGLPGVGKSTLAREIGKREDAAVLRVDTAEAAMLKAGLTRSFDTGLAAYIVVRDVAADQLRLGRDVIIDAVNAVEEARAMWRSLANESGADLFFVEVKCSNPDEHRRRVERRSGDTPPLPAPTWSEVVSREYAPWGDPILTVDTMEPMEACVGEVLNYLSSG
jgi:predicted kinase